MASFTANALIAFIVSVVMMLASESNQPVRGRLLFVMLVAIVFVTWTTVRSYGLTFAHFVFPGFVVMWVVPLLMRPSISGGFARATGLVMELVPSVPTQAFFRALLVLLLQAFVFLAMKERQLERQLQAWWPRLSPKVAEEAGSDEDAVVAKESGSPAESGREKN